MTGIGCSKFHADKGFNILEVNMFLARIGFLVCVYKYNVPQVKRMVCLPSMSL